MGGRASDVDGPGYRLCPLGREAYIPQPTSPISPARERPSADEAPHLTRREREVAALVAQGFTSRQIASKLVVSERTVDNHVANILKKFSLRSREQIAARMVEQSPRRD